MSQNPLPFPKALLREVLAECEPNLERAILPENMFGPDGDESESAESLVGDEGAVDEVEDFMAPAQHALAADLLVEASSEDEDDASDLSDNNLGDEVEEEEEEVQNLVPEAQKKLVRKIHGTDDDPITYGR